jgi:hypothetical protein
MLHIILIASTTETNNGFIQQLQELPDGFIQQLHQLPEDISTKIYFMWGDQRSNWYSDDQAAQIANYQYQNDQERYNDEYYFS